MKGEATILWYESLDSTQEEVRRQSDALDSLTVVASGYQSAGRGQRGNSWLAAPWENLTFSLLLRFSLGKATTANPGVRAASEVILPAKDQFMVSILTTLAVHDYLSQREIDSHIKWPNDIYCGDRKICGILIENRLVEGLVEGSIIGIGLNVNQEKFPPGVPNPTSMKLRSGRTYDVKVELETFMAVFTALLRQLSAPEGPGSLKERYLSLMYRRGVHCEWADCLRGEHFFGTIEGISEDYRLMVRDDKGTLRSFAFKEVNYII